MAFLRVLLQAIMGISTALFLQLVGGYPLVIGFFVLCMFYVVMEHLKEERQFRLDDD